MADELSGDVNVTSPPSNEPICRSGVVEILGKTMALLRAHTDRGHANSQVNTLTEVHKHITQVTMPYRHISFPCLQVTAW